MKYLITYHCDSRDRQGGISHGIEDSPEEFLERVYKYRSSGDYYYILNVLEISDEKAKEWEQEGII